jgi:hypothetical protein
MNCMLLMAALAVLPLSAIAAPPYDVTGIPVHFRVARGQSMTQAMQQARFQTWMARLRAARVTPSRETADARQPAITGGTILSSSLTVGVAGSVPKVDIGFRTGPSGLAGLTLVFTSPSGTESLDVNYSPQGLVTHNKITFEQPGSPPYYAQPGKWQMQAAYIADYAGNFVSYTQDQLAALFPKPYLTIVNNGPVDITPPTVTSGQILTPTVRMSSAAPVFEATLTGSDDVSGLYAPFVGIEAPGGSYSQVDQVLMPFPLAQGTATAYSSLFPGQPTGKWAITFYAFCDVVGNCFTDYSPADIQTLFGTTTFHVIK